MTPAITMEQVNEVLQSKPFPNGVPLRAYIDVGPGIDKARVVKAIIDLADLMRRMK